MLIVAVVLYAAGADGCGAAAPAADRGARVHRRTYSELHRSGQGSHPGSGVTTLIAGGLQQHVQRIPGSRRLIRPP